LSKIAKKKVALPSLVSTHRRHPTLSPPIAAILSPSTTMNTINPVTHHDAKSS
jgi:hypothetical protein